MSRVLGIDVGSAIMGWAIVDRDKSLNSGMKMVEYGVVTTPAGKSDSERLKILYDGLKQVIDLYTPEEAAIESLFFFKNKTTVMTVSQARGVILLACEEAGLPIFDYTPLQVKSAITGYGKADKQQVQKMVKLILGLKEIPKPDDAADAIAVCACHINSSSFLNRVG